MRFSVTILSLVLLIGLAAEFCEACDCDYHPGGCTISKAPAAGFKCKCKYKGFWTCSGYSVGCDDEEKCPGDCHSQSCCNRGGGDCGGY